MEERNGNTAMLDLMQRPAFRVEDGIISHVNPAASQYLISAGSRIEPLIAVGSEEYAAFTDGRLYLMLQIGSRQLGASVAHIAGSDIFILEQQLDQPELRAMALAAMELREPLSGVMTVADRLFPIIPQDNPTAQAHTAQINRRLFQMLRMVSNMSDALLYTRPGAANLEYLEIPSFFDELFATASALLSRAGMTLQFSGLQETVYSMADREKLERAVYNILSNAIKYSPSGSILEARLTRRDKRLYLSITDCGSGIHHNISGDPYTYFQREPALEDHRSGIGLGMVLVRATAALHGGAVLIDQPKGSGTRVTMTLEIRQSKSTMVRSPVLRIDYAGERDHGLLELSDVLPAELYDTANIN